DFTHDHELLALVEPGRYAIESGTPRTDRGFSFPLSALDQVVVEEQVPHSTALHASLAGRARYLTGPLARYALSGQWLPPLARQAADAAAGGDRLRRHRGAAGGAVPPLPARRRRHRRQRPDRAAHLAEPGLRGGGPAPVRGRPAAPGRPSPDARL